MKKDKENLYELEVALCSLVGIAEDTVGKEEFVKLDNAGADIIDYIDELKEYRAIGTIEEFKALKEKSVAKKQGDIDDIDSHLRLSKTGFLCCSKTNKAIRYPFINLTDLEYCPCCGQKLDWNE